MLLLAHPTGNTFSRAAALAFLEAGWLSEFHTCVSWNTSSPFSSFVPASWTAQLNRRSFSDLPYSIQHCYPWRELLRLSGIASRFPWLSRHERGPLSIDAIYRSFDRHVSARLLDSRQLRAVFSYEDAALQTFQAAQKLGLRRFYDLPIGYWRSGHEIFEEECELQPEWACTLTGLADSPAKLERKDQELQLADLVVVPSAFVRTTLLAHSATSGPIAVLPFGSPQALAFPSRTCSTGTLRLLFVGSLGQRKGLSYALDAVAALGSQVSLTLIGRITAPNCRPLISALEHHHWIETLAHDQILEQMRHHDVLLLPSLFEGYALVISEALSQGLPIITTANSGADPIIRDGIEGFIVPIRDSQAIADRVQNLVDNRDQLAVMRQACLCRATEFNWPFYQHALRSVVAEALNLDESEV